MANFKYQLDLAPIWNNDDLSIESKGKAIASLIQKKFSKMLDYDGDSYDDQLDDIVQAFENITGYDDTSPVEEFDTWMDELYNWGDNEIQPYDQWPRNKMCWIITNA